MDWRGKVHRMAACMAYVFFVPLRIHPFFSGFLGTVRIPTDVHGQDLLLALVPLHHLRLGRKKGVQGLWVVNQSNDYFRWFGRYIYIYVQYIYIYVQYIYMYNIYIYTYIYVYLQVYVIMCIYICCSNVQLILTPQKKRMFATIQSGWLQRSRALDVHLMCVDGSFFDPSYVSVARWWFQI